jgi:hypothetical protein
LLQRGAFERVFCDTRQIEHHHADHNQQAITSLHVVKDVAPALQAGEQLAFEIESEQLVGQGDFVSCEIFRKQRKGLLGIAAYQSFINLANFTRIGKSGIIQRCVSSILRPRPEAGC